MRKLILLVGLLLVSKDSIYAQSEEQVLGVAEPFIIVPDTAEGEHPDNKIPGDQYLINRPQNCLDGYMIIDETYEDDDGTIISGRKVPCKEETLPVKKGRVYRHEYKVNDEDLIPIRLIPEDTVFIPTRRGWKSTVTKKIYGKKWLDEMRAKDPDFGKRKQP